MVGLKKILLYAFLCGSVFCIHSKDEDVLKMTNVEKVRELYQIMKDVHEVLTIKGIRYWVDAGTLLGAVRHKGLIPWDFDIDIAVDNAQYEEFVALKPIFQDLGYDFFYKYSGYKIQSKAARLDVLFMRIDENENMVKFASKQHLWRWGSRDGKPLHFKIEEFFPLREYSFGEIKVMGPLDPIPYLNNTYGEGWQDFARYKNGTDGKWNSVSVLLTEELRRPAKPTGPLEDRVIVPELVP